MSKFTGGEWKVIQGAGIDELDVISEEERNICCLFGYSVSRRDEQKVNARLIAAAPEMYGLLQNFAYPEEPYDTREAELSNKVWELLRRIDGKEAAHE